MLTIKRKNRIMQFVLILTVVSASSYSSILLDQASNGDTVLSEFTKVNEILNLLSNRDIDIKSQAVLQLNQNADLIKDSTIIIDIKNALISELKNETNYLRSNEFGEGRGEYYTNVLDAILNIMEDDPVIINPLIDSMTIIGGHKIPDAISVFGATAALQLFEKYDEDEENKVKWMYRKNVLKTFKKILEKSNINPSLQNQIKEFSTDKLNDISFTVRKSAIDVLVVISEPDVIPLLQSIMQADTFRLEKGEGSEKQIVYPVRERAKWAIQQIQQKNQSQN